MEHHDKALPIDIRTLGEMAEKCHAFAKALHYKETGTCGYRHLLCSFLISSDFDCALGCMVTLFPEFHSSPSSTIEALISINNKLQLPDSAHGILKYAQLHDVPVKESWYEKLQQWEDALDAYERKLAALQSSQAVIVGSHSTSNSSNSSRNSSSNFLPSLLHTHSNPQSRPHGRSSFSSVNEHESSHLPANGSEYASHNASRDNSDDDESEAVPLVLLDAS